MGFADCKEVAITTSGYIPDSEVVYGLYTPPTNIAEWDSRWEVKALKTCTHFWVETADEIIDNACEQFGEANKVVPKSDLHYVKVGKLLPPYDDEHLVPLVNDPKIKWNTMTGVGGIVEVEWKGYDTYLKVLENW